MLETIAIMLAKILIQHFLSSDMELRKQLQESVTRNEEHQRELQDLQKRIMEFDFSIKESNKVLADSGYKLLEIEKRIDAEKQLYEDKKVELDRVIDSKPDAVVLRESLGTTDSGTPTG